MRMVPFFIWGMLTWACGNASEVHYDVCNRHAEEGHYVQAIAECRRAVATDSSYSEAHLLLARLLLKHGQPELAAQHCQQVIALEPQRAEGYFALGRAFARQRRNDEAEAAYRQAIRLASGSRGSRRLLRKRFTVGCRRRRSFRRA